MNEKDNEISKLIGLKRYEKPEDGYFDDFLAEFQRRQRSELLQRSSRGLFVERLGTYFSDLFGSGRQQFAFAGAAACAVVGVGIFFTGAFDGTQDANPNANPGDLTRNQSQIQSQGSAIAGNVESSGQSSILWEEPRFVLIEDEQTADRQNSMTRAEWDLNALPVSATGEETISNLVPVNHGEGSPEAVPQVEF